MLTNPQILALATCTTTSVVIFATLNQAAAGKYTPDFHKTRPEFASPTRPISTPATPSNTLSPSPDNPTSGDMMRPFTPTASPSIAPFTPTASPSIAPFTPTAPDAGAQGFGVQPITPSINTLPGTDRPEFRVPDLNRPSPSP